MYLALFSGREAVSSILGLSLALYPFFFHSFTRVFEASSFVSTFQRHRQLATDKPIHSHRFEHRNIDNETPNKRRMYRPYIHAAAQLVYLLLSHTAKHSHVKWGWTHFHIRPKPQQWLKRMIKRTAVGEEYEFWERVMPQGCRWHSQLKSKYKQKSIHENLLKRDLEKHEECCRM